MKRVFRGALAVAVAAIFCATTFSSCTNDEEYDFAFELPGQIVTRLNETVVIPFTARNITSVSVMSKPAGWTVEDVDLVNWTITVKSPESYSDADNDVVILHHRGTKPRNRIRSSRKRRTIQIIIS